MNKQSSNSKLAFTARVKAVISTYSVALLFCLPNAASAAPVSYSFTATIYNVTSNSALIPNLIGTDIRGQFRYDDSLTAVGGIWRTDWRDYALLGAGTISVDVLGTTYEQVLSRAIVIDNFNPFDGYHLDRFMVLSGIRGAEPEWMQLWIDGLDTSAPSNFLSSASLPTQPLDLNRANLHASPFILETNGLAFSAWVSSLTLRTAQVPEPGTASLVLLSLVIFLSRRSTLLMRGPTR